MVSAPMVVVLRRAVDGAMLPQDFVVMIRSFLRVLLQGFHEGRVLRAGGEENVSDAAAVRDTLEIAGRPLEINCRYGEKGGR